MRRGSWARIRLQVSTKNAVAIADSRRLLIQRVASSACLSKSARLRELFLYLCERVLDDGAGEIHEHEVGHRVFGRPADYDTTADNIVRVHASMLRKRIDQYFATEGRDEPIVFEIRKGNYAPVFRRRAATPQPTPIPTVPMVERRVDWRAWLLVVVSVVFVGSAAFLWFRARGLAAPNTVISANQPTVRQFWSEIFQPGRPADVVLDDATLAFLEEVTAHRVALSEYFDRSYLRSVEEGAAARLGRDLAGPLVLKRQSSYAHAALLWKLGRTAGALHGDAKIHFARDYSFREIKADNGILLGNSRSNPWIEPFENHLALKWELDTSLGAYYPVDTAAAASERGKFRATAQTGEAHEGYATVSFLPNLGGTGKVLIISGTGGATVTAALDFLCDEWSVSQLRSLLPRDNTSTFPFFESLLKVRSRSGLPRDTNVMVIRPPKT
jgi:hypothetical protein